MIFIHLPLIALFFISLGGFLTSEISKCIFSKNHCKKESDSYLYAALTSAFGALFLFLMSGFDFPFSPFSMLLGLLFGIAVMGHLCASSMAIRVGPWSYTSIMVSLAIVVPTFSGAIFWHEIPEIGDYIGLALMIVCLICSVQKGENEKKGNAKWLLLSILAMVCMASIGLLQKTHQMSLHKGEITVFLITAFFFAAVCSTAIFFVLKRKEKALSEQTEKINAKKNLRSLLLFVTAGLGLALNHNINLYLSGALDSVVFFPVMCGGEMIGVTLFSVIVFKEKLSPKQWFGLACGAVAALLICI